MILPDSIEIMEALAEEEWYGAVAAAARKGCEERGSPAPPPLGLSEAEADAWDYAVEQWMRREKWNP